jgi:5-methylcytosine-specific restriction endonuclease McrA
MRSISSTSAAWIRMRRTEALKKQDGKCIWCMSEISRKTATAEHMQAKSKGGSNESKNITAACWWCNLVRGTMPAAKFNRLIRDRRNSPKSHLYQRQIIYRINRRTESACKRILKFGR